MSLVAIILCAGSGTRMKSNLPKVLHEIGGFPLIHHAMTTAQELNVTKTIIVVGHEAKRVSSSAISFNEEAIIVEQKEQLGTGHAVQQAMPSLSQYEGDVVVLYGDVPFITSDTIDKMIEVRKGGSDIVILGFNTEVPGSYGRMVSQNGKIEKIIEAKDATDSELQINLCNSGIILADGGNLLNLVNKLENNNANKEFYLTDIVSLANSQNQSCSLVICPESETMGVNTRFDLARAENLFQEAAREKCLDNGVTLASPENTIFSLDTTIGRDSWIGQNVVFGPGVTVESEAIIKAFCHLEDCHIGSGAKIGPFARLRPGTEVGNSAHIGNFVEVKNSSIGEVSKINHLSYIGDANIGGHVNVGAGPITCNYDGVNKHETTIEDGAFVGSNTSIIAPVKIGSNSIIAAGSVITSNVPIDALGIARSKQENKIGLGKKIMEQLRKMQFNTKKEK